MQTRSRIVSLIPSATEIVCLLDLQKQLIARSHACNYPNNILRKPAITTTTVTNKLTSAQINSVVAFAKHTGQSVFHLDQTRMEKLKPDLILSQEQCVSCATSFTQVKKAARILHADTTVLSLEPESINDMLETILLVGNYTNKMTKAKKIVSALKKRLSNVTGKLRMSKKPSVLIIEWLDPIMLAGHWVPEMVEKAGGDMLLMKKKQKSCYIAWENIIKANPDTLIIAPCGFAINRTRQEMDLLTKKAGWHDLKAVKNKQVFLMDGDAYITRSGPRLIDGVEILAGIFHPDLIGRQDASSASKFFRA